MKFRVFLMITAFLSLILALSVGWQLHRQRQANELCFAVRHGNTNVALTLLHSGADPNTREPVTPETTPMQALHRLWNHWRNPQKAANADYGASVLQLAVQKDNVAVIKDLLERGASDINALEKPEEDHSYEEPRSLIVVVTEKKHPELAWMFLQRGAAQSREEKERLLCAAAYGDNLELARYLINMGVNADGVAKWDESDEPDKCLPLIGAVRNRNLAIATLLLEHHAHADVKYADLPVMTDAATEGNNAMIKLLLAHGAKVDSRSRFGTPLCFAAENGHLDVVKTLVAAGADVNYNGYGGSVLSHTMYSHDASENKRLPILKLLLAKGANTNASQKGNWTVLLTAAGFGELKTAKLLLDYGANINHYASHGDTALTIAVEYDRLDVVRLLLSRGAKIRMIVKNEYDDEPILKHIDAMKKAKKPAMKALLRRYDRH